MLSKFLNPKNDLAFKRIFGSEKNKDILIHFLNDIFGRTSNPIEEVTFLKTAQEPEIAAQRTSIVDILCQDTLGHRFIIEIQVAHESGFIKRAQYYAAKTYIEQRERGIEYTDLKQVIFLAITDFILFPDKADYLSHHALLDQETHAHDLKDFSFSFLELPKFKKKKSDLKSLTEKWSYFLKYAQDTPESDLPSIVGNDGIIQRAFNELDRFAWSIDDIRNYDSIDMKRSADKDILATAMAQGEAKGKAKGLAEGEAKGKAEGLAEGKAEQKLEIAKNLLLQNVSLAVIREVTGLTEPELQALADGLGSGVYE
jgi:predicted transposase/invertase (TIGR01784 family)